MVKKKNSINQNFEALKAQMQAKRRLAENKFEQENNTNIRPIRDTKKDEAEEEYITLNIIDDEDDEERKSEIPKGTVRDNTKLETHVIEDSKNNEESLEGVVKEPVRIITPNDKKVESTPDINMNKIVLKKVEKQEAPKRITYYLKPETIKKIDKFSKAAGMGKSEFVQTILDEILNNLEIEK